MIHTIKKVTTIQIISTSLSSSNMNNTPNQINNELVEQTAKALISKNVKATIVETAVDALLEVKNLIPEGASVMNGSSITLKQIGFVDYLKSGEHKWNNLHEGIVNEKDPTKQAELRRQSVLSDFYLGSVHALVKNGEYIIASNTGSQLSHVVFTSPNIIFVVSTKKIVSSLEVAIKRLENVVIPLEDERMQEAYGTGTALNKILIIKNENPQMGRNVHMILVKEDLGF